jgi:hypothetical protein
MTDEAHVDGNAIGGLLIEVFGQEMTGTHGSCAGCGAVNAIGSMIVYRSGPGDVVLCPSCETVLLVAASLPAGPRIYVSKLRWLESPTS